MDRYIAYVSPPPGSDVSKSFLAGAVTGSRPFKSMTAAKRFAIRMQRLGWHVVIRSAKENPISPKTRTLLGVGLLAGAGVAAYTLLSSKPAAAALGPIGIDPAMAGQTIPVSVGQTVTFSLPLAAGQSWQATLTDPSNVLGTGAPTTQTTSSGESDTYLVAAAGTAQVSYQLFNGSGTSATASGSPLNFTLIAAPTAAVA
jgi:hypothetical protein